MNRKRFARRLRTQERVLLLAGIAVLPPWLLALAWVLEPEQSLLRWELFVLATLASAAATWALRTRMIRPLQALANLLEALREGDYSMRGRRTDPEDALGEVMIEVNRLSRTLHHQRLEALEAGMLLRKIIDEIDLAVFAFDSARRIRLANRAGETLLGEPAASLRDRSAAEIGLEELLQQPSGRIVSRIFPGGSGRWEVRRRGFREAGLPHELLVVSDLSRALRDEERQAWQRLLRVLGHELNNSLAPIKSMAGSLQTLLVRDALPDDWREDALSAMRVIGERADSLGRFTNAYTRLARLPPPRRRPTELAALMHRAVTLEGKGGIACAGGPPAEVLADPDQLEQVLINLLKNAREAAGDPRGVRARWTVNGRWLEVQIEDDGAGLARTDNLWTPFFTTKPGGSGIGLLLCREIAENHGGSIELANRKDASGCVATLRLPRLLAPEVRGMC